MDTEIRQKYLVGQMLMPADIFNYRMYLLEELPKVPDDLELLIPWSVQIDSKI